MRRGPPWAPTGGGTIPGGGPIGAPAAPSVLSNTVTVAEFTLVVTIRLLSGKTWTMWVRFCPMPMMRSTLPDAGFVTADRLRCLRGEPQLAADKVQPVRPTQRAQIDCPNLFSVRSGQSS